MNAPHIVSETNCVNAKIGYSNVRNPQFPLALFASRVLCPRYLHLASGMGHIPGAVRQRFFERAQMGEMESGTVRRGQGG